MPALRAVGRNLPLLRDIATTSASRIYSTLIALLTLTLTARWLGPEGRGVVVVMRDDALEIHPFRLAKGGEEIRYVTAVKF